MMSLDYRAFDASHLNSMNSSSNVGYKIHVLLVEHDSIDHDKIINMLRCFNYEVTSVNHASSGLSVLSKEKAQFDLVIANMSSPDSFGYQLLQLALNMNLLVILTSNEDDVVGTMRALEQGVFLCVKKPVTMQFLGYVWQHVSREKKAASAQKVLAASASKTQDVVNYNNPQDPDPDQNRPEYKRKVWTEWTIDLHTKFMKAARALGPGRCYPKDILELMNVPGLTRMQVASHLQKCRNAKWLPPHQRKTKQTAAAAAAYHQQDISIPPAPAVATKKAPRSRPESFGSMPAFDDVIINTTPSARQDQINPQQFTAAFEAYNNPTDVQLGSHNNNNNNNLEEYVVNYGTNLQENMNMNMNMGQGCDESAVYQTLTPIIPLDDVMTHGDAFGAPFMNMGQEYLSQFQLHPHPQLGFDYNGTWHPLPDSHDNHILDQVGINGSDVGNGGGKLQYWANCGGFQTQPHPLNDDGIGWHML